MKLSKILITSLLLASTNVMSQTKIHYPQKDSLDHERRLNVCKFPQQTSETKIGATPAGELVKPKKDVCLKCGKG